MADEHHEPGDAAADDLFATAARRPRSAPADAPADAPDDTVGADTADEDTTDPVDDATDDALHTAPDDDATEEDAAAPTSAESPYPDGPGGAPHTDQVPVAGPELERHQPYRPAPLGHHRPPPSSPDGAGGYRAGAYPAGPPAPVQPTFGRRAPRQGPRPDADGYYPSDYYLGTDWTRVVIGGLATLILGVAAVAAGLWLYEEFDPRNDDDEVTAEATPTPVPLVAVYACAGDAAAVTEIPAPNALLIAGRTADSRWLAFRNPAAPPLQLWVLAAEVPDFDPSTVGVVPCASSPQEFPTPRAIAGERPDRPPPTSGPTPTPLPTP